MFSDADASGSCFLRCAEHRTDPLLDSLRVNVHPVVGPVDRFRIPSEAFEVFVGQHAGSFADISRFENEAVVEHERKKFIERDFLSANLPARVAQAFQIGIDSLARPAAFCLM